MSTPRPRWRGTAHSLVLTWVIVAIFTTVFGIMVIANAFERDPAKRLSGAGWLGPLLVLAIGFASALWSSRAAVEVHDDALLVRFGPGWPTRRIPWDRVHSVDVIDVRPMQWGGWGYRVLAARHAQALVLRAGPGLRLKLAGDRVFVVTVDDAKRGLEAIRAVLETK